MKNNGWVRWSQWTNEGMVNFGQMHLRDIPENLRKFAAQARAVLDETGADHVVYGLKVYDKDGDLEQVKFYMTPMTDKEFQEDVASLKGCVVYAMHRLPGAVVGNAIHI